MLDTIVMMNSMVPQYVRDPEATKKAFRGGYFGSGDLAVMFPDGSISIQDRSKDLIISGGEVCRNFPYLIYANASCRMLPASRSSRVSQLLPHIELF